MVEVRIEGEENGREDNRRRVEWQGREWQGKIVNV
jgi:hypothetical protein